MYETFDHTADLGLRVRAAELDALFAEAAQALFSVIVEDLATVRPAERLDLAVSGDDRALLLFDWLRTLLYHFDADHWLLSRCDVQVTATGVSAVCWGEPFDPERHELGHEVKAITYHGLCVEPDGAGWLAEVIIDI